MYFLENKGKQTKKLKDEPGCLQPALLPKSSRLRELPARSPKA
jgi:hypothetical protein